MECADGNCEGFLGSGIVTDEQASLVLEDFLITGSALAGLQVVDAPDVQATRGLIRDNLIGVNIQETELDLGSAFDKVLNYDNETDLDSQDLPIPDAAEAIDAL